MFTAFTMPWSRTTVFPHPFAVPKVPMGPFYNYTSYIAVDQVKECIFCINKIKGDVGAIGSQV